MKQSRFLPVVARFAAAGLLALCALGLVFVGAAQAGPPAPIDIVITQPDGTQITVRQWGDEWQHGLETTDGYTLIEDEASGFYVYAGRAPDGALISAEVDGQFLIPGLDAPTSLSLQVRPDAQLVPDREPFNLESSPVLADMAGAPPVQGSGGRPMLVILVEFSNRLHQYAPAEFQQKIFGETGSVRHFYQQASFGKLDFTPAVESYVPGADGVVGWLQLGFPHPNTTNSSTSNQIAREALKAANPYVQYNDYDSDGDGYVTAKELQIVVIAAGYEASYYPYSPSIWAHQWTLDSSPLMLDEKYIGSNNYYDGDWGGYAIFGEIHADHSATIGVMAHEIGHLLRMPDLYDTDSAKDWEGAGVWSVMGSGSWNGLTQYGDTPALPDAWSKWYMGWITPSLPSANGFRTLIPKSSTNPYALLVGSNPGGVDWHFYQQSGTGQYWLVENRQLKGYDAALPGCGLLVWHIHENVSSYNDANAYPGYPLLALEQADGRGEMDFYNPYNPYSPSSPPYSNRGDSGDPFPGALTNLRFGPGTTPGSNYSDAYGTQTPSNYTLSFENSACADWMYLRFDNGSAPVDTPYQYYLPQISRGALYATGTVRSGGAPLSGQSVQMMYSTDGGDSYAPYGSPALTNAAGQYSLRLPPLLAAETKYYMLWQNPLPSNDGRLSSFECTPRSSVDSVHNCDFDVAGINLLAPASGASVTPGYYAVFSWARRPFATDSYALQLYDTSKARWFYSDYLGYTDRITVTKAPSGAQANVTYYWSVRVKTASGIGFAFEKRPFKFSSVGSPPLESAPGPAWNPDVPE